MEEWPDDHLDELFRKSAEEFDAQFNADDWADMSRRLDENDRQMVFDRISRWGGISALVLLLLSGLGWMMYDKKPADAHRQPVITLLTPASKPAGRSAESGQPGNFNAVPERQVTKTPQPNDVDKRPAHTEGKQEDLAAKKSVSAPADRQPANTTDDRTTTTGKQKAAPAIEAFSIRDAGRAIHEKPLTVAAEPLATRSVKRRGPRQPVTGSGTPPVGTPVEGPRAAATDQLDKTVQVRKWSPVASPNPDSGSPDAGERIETQPDLVTKSPIAAEPASRQAPDNGPWLPVLTKATSQSSLVQQVRSATEPALPAATPGSRSVLKLSRLSVLLFASPDLSGVGLTNFERPGTNAGLAIQYQLTDRLSVNTGAMYSTKRYQSYSDNYVWPSYMNMEVWPDDISGVCKMIDIPLNIRYDWLLRRRGDGRAPARWFTNAGLTSYFIRHEVYSYEYANPADPKIKSWGWDNQKAGRPGGSFGFSNLNLSIGYERPITNRLSWQVEPFMKIPLKQVGYFKVRLLSTGAFVGLRYRL
ncbi:hypothetical protein [Fibrella arboris]|uniref:hypothetical protein n=1 Tax=Fibrella arboris TaxID=3242486 RepID=UPI003520EE5D